MHKANISTETRTFVHCPNCGERDGQIDHLFSMQMPFETTWNCGECGARYDLEVANREDIKVSIISGEGNSVSCLSVLVLMPRKTPVFAVVSSKDYGRNNNGKTPFDGMEHYYNEYTCPTNWSSDIEAWVADGSSDPHGLFRYIESVDIPDHVLKSKDKIALEEFILEAFPYVLDAHGKAQLAKLPKE